MAVSLAARSLLLAVVFAFWSRPAIAAEPARMLVIANPETMGLSLFRAHWDTPIPLAEEGARSWWDGVTDKAHGAFADWSVAGRKGQPGALACDALNRSLLLRFPDATARIATELRAGRSIAKVEIVLPFLDEELFPPGRPDWPGPEAYSYRANWGVQELYLQSRARWHVVASVLRRPWRADEGLGPTLNSAINGAVSWQKFGAQDEKADRFPQVFGPAEVSAEVPEGRLDVTAALLDRAFGSTLPQRLRNFADCGVIVRKWETYDHRYFRGVYEWATATGGRAILFRAPRLEVTFANGAGERVDPLPPAADISALAAQARTSDGNRGRLTAVLPSAAEIAQLATEAERRPAWADDVQWQRLQELFALERGSSSQLPRWCQFLPPHLVDAALRSVPRTADGSPDRSALASATYGIWIDKLIGRQTRGWDGFEAANEFSEWQLARAILPEPAVEAIRRYWIDWLMPDRDTCPRDQLLNPEWKDGTLVHPMADQLARAKSGPPTSVSVEDTYWRTTGDWRGNKSFFRSGFLFTESTQNFNTTASISAVVFGHAIGSERAMADGRHGVREWLLNHWIWNDGSSQEHLDHYYFGVTLKGLKTLANGAPDGDTRLMAESLLTKGLEEAVGAWHPRLRRFMAPSSRTSLEYLLGSQDGLQYIMHSLSRRGALTDVDRPALPGNIPVFTRETSADLAARLALAAPWAPPELAALVDEKPLPWEATHRFQKSWRRAWLGRHYGMASLSTTGEARIQAMAQWQREDHETRSALDLGTLDQRFGVNETRWVNDAPGWIRTAGHQIVAQRGQTWLALGAPAVTKSGLAGGGAGEEVRSLQHSLGLFDLRPGGPTWELWVKGRRVDRLPVTAHAGEPIVLRDGVTYLGIIALPDPTTGDAGEVSIEAGRPQVTAPAANPPITITPALVINSYLVRRDTPLPGETDWLALGRRFTGFAVQMADVAEEPNFEKFRARFEKNTVSTSYDSATAQARATFRTSTGVLELTALVGATFPEPGAPPKLLAACWDGQSIFPADEILRDTPTSVLGWNKVEKGGASLQAREGAPPVRLFLQTTPQRDRFIAWNPQGTPAALVLALPSGARITSAGPLGMCRLEAEASGGRLKIDLASETTGPPLGLQLEGFAAKPDVILNGRTVTPSGVTPGTSGWMIRIR